MITNISDFIKRAPILLSGVIFVGLPLVLLITALAIFKPLGFGRVQAPANPPCETIVQSVAIGQE